VPSGAAQADCFPRPNYAANHEGIEVGVRVPGYMYVISTRVPFKQSVALLLFADYYSGVFKLIADTNGRGRLP
jgi:hypothetical protein